MTIFKVVDASALVAALFGESGGTDVMNRLADARLIAPAIVDFEVTNVCLQKLRRLPDQRASILQNYGRWRRTEIERVDVDQDEVLALAEASGLTAYDASYLWLARGRRADLVTLDKQLLKAFLQAPR